MRSESDPVLRVEGLGKRYRLGERAAAYRTLRESLAGLVSSRSAAGAASELWALRGVSFDVRRGEAIGIIGRNGAGKSTLLKILSRVTPPSEGQVLLRGRVGSLLEVGTGFHSELTGRENVYLSGAILGMRRAEIRARFDEIVAFSGVERLIDTPVKRYSSGQYVRLAFAVAAHLEPEILLVDEVLAVGDLEFQRKCLGRMNDVAGAGRTVLFVSHSMGTIERLCSRAILLADGAVAATGPTRQVVEAYVGLGAARTLAWRRPAEPPASASAPRLERVGLVGVDGAPLEAVTSATEVGIAIECAVPVRSPALQLGVSIQDEKGQPVFATGPRDDGRPYPAEPGTHRYLVALPGAILMPRRYSVTVSLYDPGGAVDLRPDLLSFDVAPVASLANSVDGGRPGVLQIPCRWEHTMVEHVAAAAGSTR